MQSPVFCVPHPPRNRRLRQVNPRAFVQAGPVKILTAFVTQTARYPKRIYCLFPILNAYFCQKSLHFNNSLGL